VKLAKQDFAKEDCGAYITAELLKVIMDTAVQYHPQPAKAASRRETPPEDSRPDSTPLSRT
jgi:hypothetical protein